MTNESSLGIPNSSSNPNWQLRFLIAFSLLLIITFVYYLPTRFKALTETDSHMDGMDDMHTDTSDAMMGELPSAAEIARLPIQTPASRATLSPTLVNGVKEFRLEAEEFRWEYAPGQYVHVWGYNGQIPGPEIRVTEGDKIRIIVKNNLPVPTSVHWHGLDVPWQEDGVPGITQDAIGPGEEFTYEFDAVPAGTRFYHTHGADHMTSAQQLDMGLSGAFIVEAKTSKEDKKSAESYDRDYTLVLDEWEIMMGGINTAAGHMHGAGQAGMMDTVPDFNTFTINGRIFPHIPALAVNQGERILIRFINAGSAASHPMHLHGHSFTVVARDGFSLSKSAREERNTITINPGETLDIAINANNPGPWALHCHHIHHAAAGMTMLFQYKGYQPVGTLEETAADPSLQAAAVVFARTDPLDPTHVDEPTTMAGIVLNIRWILAGISLVLIALLSYGVNRYLNRR